ncbi:MAG: redoxin domain-containing protein [Ginsengibacter sp.]
MRKAVKIVIALLVFFIIGYFAYRIVNTIQSKNRIAENIATIPQFTFITIKHQTFTKQNISDTIGNVIIQLFSPDCEHCQYMAQSFVKNKEKLKDEEIIMVTPFGDSSSVVKFSRDYGLDSLPNVHLLLDTHADFFKIFGASLVPSFYVYKNNKLVKSIKGETKIENLLN